VAGEDDNKDSLSGARPVFLGALAFVWALAFALLILELRSGDWRTIDETSLALLAFLLGISLLPFVSQFSIAGLFEFRREIGRLRREVEGIRADVASLASASAVANQNAAQTQQVVLAAGFLEKLEDTAAQTQIRTLEAERPAEKPHGNLANTWQHSWRMLQFLVGIYYLSTQARRAGAEVFGEVKQGTFEDWFERGFHTLLAGNDPGEKAATQLRAAADVQERITAGIDVSDAELAAGLDSLIAVSAMLTGHLAVAAGVGGVAFKTLLQDPRAAPEFFQALAEWVGSGDASHDS
jgi:hypothetical protein